MDKSLLRGEEWADGEPRISMLETIREYAAEQLAASGEEESVRARHAAFFVALGVRAEPALFSTEKEAWKRRLKAELDNLRETLAWGEQHDPELMLRLAATLWRFWWAYPKEGRDGWSAMVAGGIAAPASLRVKALAGTSILASYQGGVRGGLTLAQDSVALAEKNGDQAGRVLALLMVSFAERCRGGHKEALTCAEVAAEQARALGDDELPSFIRALILNRLGNEAYELGDWSRAEAILQEALERWRRLGDPWGTSVVLGKLADIAQARGKDERAAKHYRESLNLWWGQNNQELGTVEIMTGLARLTANGQSEGAVRLFAVAEATQRRTGLILPSDNRANNDEALAAARVSLGEEAFAAAWAAGWNIPLHRAVAEARDVAVDVGRAARAAPAPRPGAAAGDLTPRELEVLGLVAEGLTNAQVAEKLFLSPRTVNAHLTSVYHKLRVGSRSAAVRFAVEHDLV